MDRDPDTGLAAAGDPPSAALAASVETLTLDPSHSPSDEDPLSPSDLCFEAESLHDLAARGQWRSVLDKVARARSLSLLPLPHDHIVYLVFNALALFKLRRFSDASSEIATLSPDPDPSIPDPFAHPRYRYDSYPDAYPGRSGSMIPFSVRYLHAELPQRLGNRPDTLDRLYSLLDLVRSRTGSIWRRRETFIMSAIFCNHFAHREFDVTLALIHDLLARDPAEPVLLSRLGYIQMQIGDLDGAKAAFARVADLSNGKGPQFENLVGRNRALEFVVAKDYVSAVREYEVCIERDPADVVALNNKALCLMYSRDLSDSIKLLEGALERVPTVAVNETLVVNLCSMYELAYVNHGEIKKSLSNWIARVAPDDFDPSCTRI